MGVRSSRRMRTLVTRMAQPVEIFLLRTAGPYIGVTCGRRPGKDFLTFLQHWSGAVTCPAW